MKPSGCTEAGYRLYDDKAMEKLKQIRSILDNPDFDRDQILKMQKVMLEKKRDRLNRLIG